MIERVLVVQTSKLRPFLTDLFMNGRNQEIYTEILQEYTFVSRPAAEDDPNFKQIIPYVLVRHGEKYLLLRRFKTQGEKRLHGKLSLGVGGHINPETPMMDYPDIIAASLRRELDEEIKINSKWEVKLLGVINDDSSDVGKVHLGLGFLLTAASPDFEVNEKDQMSAQWASVDEIEAVRDQLEAWSQILFDHCIKCQARTELTTVAALSDSQSPPQPA